MLLDTHLIFSLNIWSCFGDTCWSQARIVSATCLWCHYICQHICQFLLFNERKELLCFLRITGFSPSFLFVFLREWRNTWFELRDCVSHAPEIRCFCSTNWALAQHTISGHKPIRRRDIGCIQSQNTLRYVVFP